jgi:hypothetical protein
MAKKEICKPLIVKYLKEEEIHGNIQAACKKAGCSRTAYYDWAKEDSEFDSQVEEARRIGVDGILDLALTGLVNNLKEGDVASVIYVLKTLGKKLGFTEKDEASTQSRLDFYIDTGDGNTNSN